MGSVVKGVTDAVGLTDSDAVDESMAKAAGYTREQLKRLDAIDLPDIEKQKILLENPELVGLLEAEQLDPSALEEISLDPQAREAQLAALQSLQEYADEGMTETDKYAMEQMLGDVAAQERSRQAGVEAQMARQGMDQSGAAMMAKMQGSQSAANQAREKAMQTAAQGQQNRMNALNQLASQSGQMQQQDFSRQANVASAKDAIAQANAANRQNVNAQNLASRRALENQRAATANQQQMYNKGLIQQQFQNELSKAGAQNQASGNLANMYAQQGQVQAAADASTIGSIAGAGGALLGAAGQAQGFSKLFAEDGGVAKKDSYEDGGTAYASDGMGDIVDSGMESYAGDRVDAKINDGEMILNVPQQQRLFDVLRGKESLDNLGESDIVEGVPKEYRDELHEKKSGDMSESKRARGLKALLEALGEE